MSDYAHRIPGMGVPSGMKLEDRVFILSKSSSSWVFLLLRHSQNSRATVACQWQLAAGIRAPAPGACGHVDSIKTSLSEKTVPGILVGFVGFVTMVLG